MGKDLFLFSLKKIPWIRRDPSNVVNLVFGSLGFMYRSCKVGFSAKFLSLVSKIF